MKNKKFLACLLACLCCFQSGACIPAIAEDSAPEVTEATENLSEIQQACKQIREEFDPDWYTIVCDEEQNKIQIIVDSYEERVYRIKKFCREKGFIRKYGITFSIVSSDGEIFPEPTQEEEKQFEEVKEQIRQFIIEKINPDEEDLLVKSNYSYNVWFKTFYLYGSTQENTDKIQKFCEENQFAEKYGYKFEYTVRIQTDLSVVPAMEETAAQIQQFITENNLHPKQAHVGVDSHQESYIFGIITGFYIIAQTETREDLDKVIAYCQEQGFTDKYEIRFVANEELESCTEIIETNFTAGDVTLDGSVNILDVITVNKAILGKETLTAMQNKTADINRDDKIDSSDALEILKQIVGIAE